MFVYPGIQAKRPPATALMVCLALPRLTTYHFLTLPITSYYFPYLLVLLSTAFYCRLSLLNNLSSYLQWIFYFRNFVKFLFPVSRNFPRFLLNFAKHETKIWTQFLKFRETRNQNLANIPANLKEMIFNFNKFTKLFNLGHICSVFLHGFWSFFILGEGSFVFLTL